MTLDTLANLLTALAAIGAFVISVYNSVKIEIVHKATNSMKDELVKEVRKSEHAKGMKDERASHLSGKI
jgi:hypothetical protein